MKCYNSCLPASCHTTYACVSYLGDTIFADDNEEPLPPREPSPPPTVEATPPPKTASPSPKKPTPAAVATKPATKKATPANNKAKTNKAAKNTSTKQSKEPVVVSSAEPKRPPATVEGAGEPVEIVSSGEKRRKRQKKLVSKSFVDEDGFMGIC